MSKELQTATIKEMEIPKFKNAELQAAALEISKLGTEIRSKNVEVAKVLGRVKTTECFKEDGFKSVQEFAEHTFGIARSMAYNLAAVGERFYNSDSEVAKKAAAILPPTSLVEISRMSDEDISKAMDEGKISAKSTQKSLREQFVTKPEKKSIVMQDFKVHGILVSANPALIETIHHDAIPLEKLETSFMFRGEVKKFKTTLKGESGEPHEYNIWIDSIGAIARFTAEKCPKKKFNKSTAKDSQPKYTKEQLLAMLASLESGD